MFFTLIRLLVLEKIYLDIKKLISMIMYKPN